MLGNFLGTILSLLRYAYFQRYPLLFGLLMIVLAPVAVWGMPKRLLANVFLVHNLSQTASLTMACVCMATVITAQIWIVHENGRHRFADLDLPDWFHRQGRKNRFWSWTLLGTLLWAVVALSAPIVTVLNSWDTRAKDMVIDSKFFPANVNLTVGVQGIAAGFVVSFVVLFIVSLVNVLFGFTTAGRSFLPLDGLAGFVLGRSSPAETAGPNPARFPLSVVAWLLSGPRLKDQNETKRNGYAYTKYANAQDQTGESYFEPGHMQLGVLVLLLVTIYFVYLFLAPARERALQLDDHWFGTSFFLVLLLLFAVNAIAATAFFCDGFRLPPAVLVVLVLAWVYSDLEHDFPVHHEQPTAAAPAAPAAPQQQSQPKKIQPNLAVLQKDDLPKQIYGKRSRRPLAKDADKYLIVITAPGGGIHAAGWTSQVLTGLHARYGPRFSKSIGLISAVSGGSVGAMHYANSFEKLNDLTNHSDAGKFVVADACSSSLEAVGWGLAYEDLPRLLPLRLLRHEELDRSRVVELLWNSQLQQRVASDKAPTLRDWWDKREKGTCPPLVFNATEVESGRRVLFGNFALPNSLQELSFSGIDSRQFVDVFPHSDIEIATAARLSATFPYVFPAAKHQIPLTKTEDGRTEEKQYGFGHVVDGGYSDNEGIITAVEFIKELLRKNAAQPAELSFNKILLIRIQHHAVKKQSEYRDRAPIPVASWRAAFAGPLQAVLSVRDASQVERAAIETDLLRHMKEVSDFPIQTVYVEFVPEDLVWENREKAIVFDGHEDHDRKEHDCQLSIAADNSSTRKRSNYQSPLSWKLTPQEFEQYGKCWKIHEEKALKWRQPGTPRPALALLDEIFDYVPVDPNPAPQTP